MTGIRLPIVAPVKDALRSFEQIKLGAKSVGTTVNEVNLSVAQTAKLQGDASIKTVGYLQAQVIENKRLAAAAERNSIAQGVYTAKATAAQARLDKLTGNTVATMGGFSKSTRTAERDINKLSRGILSGTGLLGRMGRSLAFASSGFIVAATAADILVSSIKDAEDLARAQASLGVAIRHTGGDLKKLQPEYDATAKAAAQFGISEIQATTGLARATVLTGDAAAAQRAYQEALVISKATGKDFNAVLIATSKGQEGITTSLRRYGVLVDASSTGTEQFVKVMRRFGGQAAANTTEFEKLHASFTNALTTIGEGLLPTFDRLAGSLANWLTQMNQSGQLQKDVNAGLKTTKDLLGPVATGFGLLAHAVGTASDAYEKLKGASGNVPGGKSLFDKLTESFPRIIQDEIDRFHKLNAISVPGFPVAPLIKPGQFFPVLPGSVAPGPFGNAKPMKQFWQKFQLNFREQLAQAQAALTRSNADDVAEARKEVARIKRLLDEGRLHGQGLLQALALEATAMNTIQTAEQAAAQQRVQRLQNEKQQLEKRKQQFDQRLQTLHQQEANLSQRIKAIQDRYRQTVQSITQGIGALFQGPILAPTDTQRKAALGLPGPSAHRLTQDLNAQVAQYRRLNRDLAKLRREGASKALIAELRGQGVSAIPEIEALTGAGKGQRDAFFKAFAARERLAQRTARQMLSAQLHTLAVDRAQLGAIRRQEHTVTAGDKLIAGKIDKLTRAIRHGGVRTTGSGQTSGRNPGR